MPGPNNDQASAGIWLMVGVGIAVASVGYGLGSLESPDTGFMPFLAGSAMSLCALAGLAQATARRRQGIGWQPVMAGPGWRRPLIVLLALVAYALVLTSLGFVVTTALFMAFLFRAVKPLGWPAAVAGSILTALATYGIFELWLKAQLPKGPWGF